AHAVRPAVVWFRGARRARRPRLTPDPAQSDDPVSAHHCLSDRLPPARVGGRAGRGSSRVTRALTGGARPQHRAGAGAGSHAPLVPLHWLGRGIAGSLPAPPRAPHDRAGALGAARRADRAVWAMGDEALAAGVPLDRLDAGSGWDGYHLYEYGLEHRIRSRTPKGGPWWVYFYAPATDSAYVVSGKPLPGHRVIRERPYSSWLQREPTNLYLLHRDGVPWPPRPAAKEIVAVPAPGGLATVSFPWQRRRSSAPVTPAPAVD
ncbi:MAG: hypothetical protein K0R44_2936, partial [Thermomicrobiales bacterium]|nr:hypothetical protein [Thermomicrobiales bacterium]